jgi:hypothetical protein
MNASRKVFKTSSNVVKKVYQFGEKSIQGYISEGVIIVILIVLTAVVLKFLPVKFLGWFNNIIVKIIFLIIIAFVAMYSPAVGLMLAILLVSIIQMYQRKQLSLEINQISAPQNKQQNNQPDVTDYETIESYANKDNTMEPQGFNDDSSCLTGCGGGGGGSDREDKNINGMCGNVKTWNNQESAQGLDGPVVGLQSSIGYPI